MKSSQLYLLSDTVRLHISNSVWSRGASALSTKHAPGPLWIRISRCPSQFRFNSCPLGASSVTRAPEAPAELSHPKDQKRFSKGLPSEEQIYQTAICTITEKKSVFRSLPLVTGQAGGCYQPCFTDGEERKASTKSP